MRKYENELCEAASRGDLSCVKTLLAQNYPYVCGDGVTPLMTAAAHGHVDVVSYLLLRDPHKFERGFKHINSQDSQKGETALFAAVKAGYSLIVCYLLKHGALLIANYLGQTPLEVAENNSDSVVVLMLKEKAAELSYLGQTALRSAAKKGDLDPREISLAREPVATFTSTAVGSAALSAAVQNGHLELVKSLLAKAGHVFSRDQHPLWLAVKHGHESVVRYLCTGDYPQKVELLAAINTRFSRRGLTPFYQAVSEGHGIVAKCLLDAGANYLAATDYTTPLWAAAKNGHLLLVQHLLGDMGEWGLQERVLEVLDVPSKTGATALYVAAEQGHEQIVIRLLAVGAKQVPMVDGTTPLWIAANNGHVQVVNDLLEANAPYLPCKDGTKPLQAALRAGHRGVVDLFLKQKSTEVLAEIRTYIPYMAGRNLATLARLLSLGMNVNALNAKGKSAMTCALERSDFAVVALLLIYGAQISRAEAALIAADKEAVTDKICTITRTSRSLGFKRRVLNLIQRIGVCPDGAVAVDSLLKDHAFFKARSFFGIAPRVDNPKSEVSKLKELHGQIQACLQGSVAQNPQGVFAGGAVAGAPAAVSFEIMEP